MSMWRYEVRCSSKEKSGYRIIKATTIQSAMGNMKYFLTQNVDGLVVINDLTEKTEETYFIRLSGGNPMMLVFVKNRKDMKKPIEVVEPFTLYPEALRSRDLNWLKEYCIKNGIKRKLKDDITRKELLSILLNYNKPKSTIKEKPQPKQKVIEKKKSNTNKPKFIKYTGASDKAKEFDDKHKANLKLSDLELQGMKGRLYFNPYTKKYEILIKI